MNYKILIVDDEPNIIKALKRILIESHYTLLTATSSAAAIDILENNKIDVILCDQQMPGMLGIDVLTYAKKIQPETIRILVTGSSDMRVAIAAINEGSIFHFFSKPWNNEDVISVVKRALEQKREQEEKNDLYALIKDDKVNLQEVSNKLNLISGFIQSKSVEKVLTPALKKIAVLEDDNIIMINIPDILYIAAVDTNVIVNTHNGAYKSNESLYSWEEKLGQESFFRCHRGYIVNMERIEKISVWFNGAYNIKLEGMNESIPVSRNYAKKLKLLLNI